MTKRLLEEILPGTAIRDISELINVGLDLHDEQFLTVSSEQWRRVFGSSKQFRRIFHENSIWRGARGKGPSKATFDS